MKLALNLLEYLRIDQAGHWNRDNFLLGLALARQRPTVLISCEAGYPWGLGGG
jgi:hypothetical protein